MVLPVTVSHLSHSAVAQLRAMSLDFRAALGIRKPRSSNELGQYAVAVLGIASPFIYDDKSSVTSPRQTCLLKLRILESLSLSQRLTSIITFPIFVSLPQECNTMLLSSLATGYALLALLLSSFTRAQTAHQSIYTVDAFAAQPTCVQGCFTAGYGPDIDCNTDVLGSLLGCPNTPCVTAFAAVDSCYCRGDLQSAASKLLGACINEVCSVGDNSVNLATAVSIYSDYCHERGLTAAPASTTAKTKNGTATPTIPDVVSGTTPPSATPSGKNTLTIVLASVSTVFGVGMLIAAVFCWRYRWLSRHCLNGHVQINSTKAWVSKLSGPSGSESTSQDVLPPTGPILLPYPPSVLSTNI
jgi:hypothetical protein